MTRGTNDKRNAGTPTKSLPQRNAFRLGVIQKSLLSGVPCWSNKTLFPRLTFLIDIKYRRHMTFISELKCNKQN